MNYITIFEVTAAFQSEGKRISHTFKSEDGGWDECHASISSFIKRNYTDADIKLDHYEIVHTASFRVRDDY